MTLFSETFHHLQQSGRMLFQNTINEQHPIRSLNQERVTAEAVYKANTLLLQCRKIIFLTLAG